jgi:Beta-galactosidase/beta-glucuronidase
MSKKDFFANIALGNITNETNELAESLPVDIKKTYFAKSDAACPVIEEISYEKRLEDFKASLQEIKNSYKPFLSDNVPASAHIHKKTELRTFQFRYMTDEDRNIAYALDGQGEWELVGIPDYRGPVGKWTGYYRTTFKYSQVESNKRIYLRFYGVDYIANIYLNNRHIGFHEGFFASFEFDVTDYIYCDRDNVLLVEIKNDIPTVGLNDEKINGDKIYAATGLGWDNPNDGWHHCPPGAGICNKVILEEKPVIYIDSIYMRPDLDNDNIEARIQINNTKNENLPVKLYISVFPRNFKGESLAENHMEGELEPAGNGLNYYRINIPIKGFRLWTCEEPWLYTARVNLDMGGHYLPDSMDSVFGIRKFHMDVESEPRGTLFLNNKPIILRGANDMGHMQQCVMKQDFDQLVEDILIAKLANMNYYRFTQRPVQEEIYLYCDMLGMMNQTDLPLFGYLRKSQLYEAIRQCGEMERLIRNHPSAIMVSYINEPFPVIDHAMGHRHLFRDELEAFFEAADSVIYVENPDRVVKHVEGDYDPPTHTGLSDFHCYNLWYTNHALPFGKLYKGYLPALKRGWKTGCGEYGTEGLDNLEVMQRYYPSDWLPENLEMCWNPGGIVQSQTSSMHGDWFEEQENIMDWINESQKHQAFATRIMTDAFRRRSDRIVSTAVHLLIDAWPSGWMKTLVGVDRVPKPSYFEYKAALVSVRVNLRCDRWKAYSGESIDVEVWILNDTAEKYDKCSITATLRDDTCEYASYISEYAANPTASECVGIIKIDIPEVIGRRTLYLDTRLEYKRNDITAGKIVANNERFELEAFQRLQPAYNGTVLYAGRNAAGVIEGLKLHARAQDYAKYYNNASENEIIMISDCKLYNVIREQVDQDVRAGGVAVFLTPNEGESSWEFAGRQIKYSRIFEGNYCDGIDLEMEQGLFYVARNPDDPKTNDFAPTDFSWWYNSKTDMLDYASTRYIEGEGLVPLLYTYRKPSFRGSQKEGKEKLPVAACLEYGKGTVYFISLRLDGRVGWNPVLDKFIMKVLGLI